MNSAEVREQILSRAAALVPNRIPSPAKWR